MPVLRWTSEGGQGSALGGGEVGKTHKRFTCLVCCLVHKNSIINLHSNRTHFVPSMMIFLLHRGQILHLTENQQNATSSVACGVFWFYNGSILGDTSNFRSNPCVSKKLFRIFWAFKAKTSQMHVGLSEIYPCGSFDAFVSSWVATSCMWVMGLLCVYLCLQKKKKMWMLSFSCQQDLLSQQPGRPFLISPWCCLYP